MTHQTSCCVSHHALGAVHIIVQSLATSLLHIIVAKKGISEKGIQREVGNVKASTVRAQLQVQYRVDTNKTS